MKDRDFQARLLDEEAAKEAGLAKAQALSAEADRLRQTPREPFMSGFRLPLLRN